MLTLLCAVSLPAQPALTPAIEQHIAQAEGLEVEFAVDILLPLLKTGLLKPKDEARVLATLYGRTEEAAQPFPVVPAPTDAGTSGASAIAAFGNTQLVDGLTMKLRILDRLRRIDPKQAQALAEGLRDPALPSVRGCDGLLIPYLGDHFFPVMSQFKGLAPIWIGSPQELAAFVKFASETKVPQDWQRNGTIIAGSLTSLQTTDRVFTAVELHLELGSNLEKVLARSELSSGARKSIVDAYKGYVIRHMKKARCSDVVSQGEDSIAKGILPRVNRLIAGYQETPVKLEDVKPEAVIAGPSVPAASQRPDPQTYVLMEQYSKFGNSGDRVKLERLIDGIAKGQSDTDCKVCYLAKSTGFLLNFADKLGGADPVFEYAMSTLFNMLSDQSVKKSSPSTWIAVVKQVVNYTHHPDPKISIFFNRELGRTSDPALAAYLRAETLGGKKLYVANAYAKGDAFVPEF
jgi:hypothetical protein